MFKSEEDEPDHGEFKTVGNKVCLVKYSQIVQITFTFLFSLLWDTDVLHLFTYYPLGAFRYSVYAKL